MALLLQIISLTKVYFDNFNYTYMCMYASIHDILFVRFVFVGFLMVLLLLCLCLFVVVFCCFCCCCFVCFFFLFFFGGGTLQS